MSTRESMAADKYLQADDHRKYLQFTARQLAPFMRPPPEILWHYTSGDALVRIPEGGTLFSTQIACLNDSTEFTYARNVLFEALDEIKPVNDDDACILEKVLSNRPGGGPITEGRFVTCFSAQADDLSQWRAYSGGENGYAIGFSGESLRLMFSNTDSHLLPVLYDESRQRCLAKELAEATARFFREAAENHRGVRREYIGEEFLQTWSPYLTIFAPLVKHPSFAAEEEWRIVHTFTLQDVAQLLFKQKATLLARHLPLDLRREGRMPLAKVLVGPSRHKEISKVSVGDLLHKLGYNPAIASVSQVPFQST